MREDILYPIKTLGHAAPERPLYRFRSIDTLRRIEKQHIV